MMECETMRNVFMLGEDEAEKCHSLSVHLKKTTTSKENKRGIYRKKKCEKRRDTKIERERERIKRRESDPPSETL